MTTRRWILVFVAVVVALAVTIWARINSAWSEMESAADRVQAEFESASAIRVVAWGEATAGSASAGYTRAETAFKDSGLSELIGPQGRSVAEWLESPGTAPPVCWESIEKLRPIFAMIRQAGHCRDATFSIPWAEGFSRAVPSVVVRFELDKFLSLRAWQLGQAGDDLEAARCLLDALQYARDQADEPVAINSMVGAAGIDAVAETFFQRADTDGQVHPAAWRIEDLSRDALRLLRDGLAKLDRPLSPLAQVVRSEALLFVREIQQSGVSISGSNIGVFRAGMMKNSWRFAFSERWMCAQAALDSLDVAEQLPKTAAWATWPDHLERVAQSNRVSLNPVMRMIAINYSSIAIGRIKGLVSLRVLRMLVDEALGEPSKYPDPFGTTLNADKVGGKTRYWSVGGDGVGQNGDPQKDIVYIR